MTSSSALLGQENSNATKTTDERDLQERSTKKIKDGEHEFSNQSSVPKDYSDLMDLLSKEIGGGRSYKATFVGEVEEEMLKDTLEDEGSDVGEGDAEGIRIEEKKFGEYECPEFNGHMEMGPTQIVQPNIPRPPNAGVHTPIFDPNVQHQGYNLGVENDEFMDANENATTGESGSDMEVVHETPQTDQ
ncbi:hypothetical protein TSUD_145740 [Trifolium subterraneum]|uniref:Uncharacterized protein n=1 Tax=Trifolium subterraneum TaxID=3900 RepID=A0A2Z6N8W5_TRISU|nr:hypothetical protein TSUD_145740 [Trifolium subterraneum]